MVNGLHQDGQEGTFRESLPISRQRWPRWWTGVLSSIRARPASCSPR
jgi:hypothetical protein